MDISFYTAAVGAKAQQTRFDVIGNNMANANTAGYKAQKAGFVDLLYSNVREPETTDTQLVVGAGARVEKTDINFKDGGLASTDAPTDFAIVGKGFFAVRDPGTGEVLYTRSGAFQYSQGRNGIFYLVTAGGQRVLDKNMNPITMPEENKSIEKPGVFGFKILDGMLLRGDSMFSPTAKNGQPYIVENSQVQSGYLENSNTEVADQMTKIIETQRAYSMMLKMVTTSNEIEQTINELRG